MAALRTSIRDRVRCILGDPMKLSALFVVAILSFIALVPAYAYDRGMGYQGYNYDPYQQYGAGSPYNYQNYNSYNPYGQYQQYGNQYDPYRPYYVDPSTNFSYAYSRSGPGYYDPVIYGGLGNYYYAGGYVGSGFPITGSRYTPFGNIYRYDGNSYGGY